MINENRKRKSQMVNNKWTHRVACMEHLGTLDKATLLRCLGKHIEPPGTLHLDTLLTPHLPALEPPFPWFAVAVLPFKQKKASPSWALWLLDLLHHALGGVVVPCERFALMIMREALL